MPVSVITDSAAALPVEVAERAEIAVVPLRLVLGGRSFRDGELDPREVLARAAEGVTDAELRSVMVCYRDVLGSHQQALNRLSVYRVPDADTGTNMTLTVEAVVSALGQATGMASTCRAISRGALLGGRGISGVVLAQLLGATATRFAHSDSIDGSVLVQQHLGRDANPDQLVQPCPRAARAVGPLLGGHPGRGSGRRRCGPGCGWRGQGLVTSRRRTHPVATERAPQNIEHPP
jgi:hypothetical protein